MGKDKKTGARTPESLENIPPQTADSESEFSVDQSLAEDFAKQHQQSGKHAQQQSGAGGASQEDESRSSESEFSQDGKNRSDD